MKHQKTTFSNCLKRFFLFVLVFCPNNCSVNEEGAEDEVGDGDDDGDYFLDRSDSEPSLQNSELAFYEIKIYKGSLSNQRIWRRFDTRFVDFDCWSFDAGLQSKIFVIFSKFRDFQTFECRKFQNRLASVFKKFC